MKKRLVKKRIVNKNKMLMKISRNIYLDELGLSKDEYEINYCNRKDDDRQKKWMEQRLKYGFDSRETWNLDKTMLEWLYSHLCMYQEESIVDMDYEKIEYKGKEYSINEVLNFITEWIGTYLLLKDEDYCCFKEDTKYAFNMVEESLHLLSETYSTLWW